MKNEHLGLENAFPLDYDSCGGVVRYSGMSKRLYLAGMAMQGLCAATDIYREKVDEKWIAEKSLSIADELLKQESL